MPSERAVQLCHDKYAFNQALIEAGFGSNIPRVAQGLALTPPYILKRRTGEWGVECYLIRDREDEEANLDRITNPSFFCQEFISGATEFATHVLFLGGKIAKALNIQYTFASDMPIKGKDTEILRGIHRCPHLGLFAQILRAIQFEGLCCVNYKIAKGRSFLIEINPRFGASLAPYFFSFVRHLR